MRKKTKIILCGLMSVLIATLTIFAVVAEIGTEEVPPFSQGDVNGDGKITAVDARLALRGSAKLIELTEQQQKAADINGDGKVTAADARRILRISAKLEDIPAQSMQWQWWADVDDNHVVITDENGNGYINNRILIFFNTNDINQIQSVISSIDGKILGHSLKKYQVEIAVKANIEEIREICKQVSKLDGVLAAWPEFTFQDFSNQSIPNDPWKDTVQGILGTNWNEEKPDGLNWWLETIQAPSAWEYNNRFNSIKIGIVDSGFDTEHEDLDITVLNSDVNSTENHGTHVAGIIGAKANNEKGITGIVWNSELYGVDIKQTKKQEKNNISVIDIYEGIELALRNGCKVINLSQGAKKALSNNFDDIYNIGGLAVVYVLSWEEELNRNDFLIIQSAGNKNIDSTRNGYFCSITNEVIDKLFKEYDIEDYTYNDVYEHIIIVGAIEQDNNGYKLCYQPLFEVNPLYSFDSAYGDYISVVAPGKKIFSTLTTGGLDGSYGYGSGTSAAAPMVTGVAGLIWSVKGNAFSAREVKEMVCNYTKDIATSNQKSDNRIYKVVNAKLAVEEAIRRVENNTGKIQCTVKIDNPIVPISGVTITIENMNGIEVGKYETDANGKFAIELKYGRYKLRFSRMYQGKNYWLPTPIECTVEIGKTKNIGTVTLVELKNPFDDDENDKNNNENKTGDDGVTNWDFIEPVTHLKTVPSGYTGIYTAQDLNNIRNNPIGNYILMNDIDLSSWGNWTPIGDGISYVPISISNSEEFDTAIRIQGVPLYIANGNSYRQILSYSSSYDIYYCRSIFYGTFDGNGYIIKNMTTDVENSNTVYAGLFRSVSNGTIKNVGMVGSTISAKTTDNSYVYAGGVVGFIEANGGRVSNIINCYNTGNISITTSSSSVVGGIVGYIGPLSSISNCYNTGTVNVASFSSYTGGIVGSIGSVSSATNCYNTGTISNITISSSYVGGITGELLADSFILNCYNSGNISSSSATIDIGGVAGNTFLGSSIKNCYNTGNINAISSSSSIYSTICVGGISGGLDYYSSTANNSLVSNCYNIGNINASSDSTVYTGGIIGATYPIRIISNCYFLNNIISGVGNDKGTLTNVNPLFESEMKQQSSYEGFDFDTTWAIDPNKNSGYPYLR